MHSFPPSWQGFIVFLTSDPGTGIDAHTAVGAAGLHGNFPCTADTGSEEEGEWDVSHMLRGNMHTRDISFLFLQFQ